MILTAKELFLLKTAIYSKYDYEPIYNKIKENFHTEEEIADAINNFNEDNLRLSELPNPPSFEEYKDFVAHGLGIEDLPQDLLDDCDIWQQFVTYKGSNIHKVPKDCLTEDVLVAAVKHDPYNIADLDEEIFTQEICNAIVAADADSIRFIPEEFMTEDLLFKALTKSGLAIEDIPKQVLTPELILVAIENHYDALSSIPEDMVTQEMVSKAYERYSKYPAESKSKEDFLYRYPVARKFL